MTQTPNTLFIKRFLKGGCQRKAVNGVHCSGNRLGRFTGLARLFKLQSCRLDW